MRTRLVGVAHSSSVSRVHVIDFEELLIVLGAATYLLLWPRDGRMMKEDIRGIYDGSIFYTIAARREKTQ